MLSCLLALVLCEDSLEWYLQQEWELYKCKKPCIAARLSDFKIGIDILSQALDQVPSAQVGLTSLFGMGRGDPHRNRRHKGINVWFLV